MDPGSDRNMLIVNPLNVSPSNSHDYNLATRDLKSFLSNAGILQNGINAPVGLPVAHGNNAENANFANNKIMSLLTNNHINDSIVSNNGNQKGKTSNTNNFDGIGSAQTNVNGTHVYAGTIKRQFSKKNKASPMPFVNGKYICDIPITSHNEHANKSNKKKSNIKDHKNVGNKVMAHNHKVSTSTNHFALPLYMRAPPPSTVPIPKQLLKDS